jgi:hypothetical protein
MKSSNLAQRLEDFEAVVESLRLTPSPVTQRLASEEAPGVPQETTRPVRRALRVRSIRIRDQGLRLFRVS